MATPHCLSDDLELYEGAQPAAWATVQGLESFDANVTAEWSDKVRLKEALGLAPMDQCTLKHKSPLREWWRYGWAWGFMCRNLADAQAPVHCKSYRDAIAMGYLLGKQHHLELEASAHSD